MNLDLDPRLSAHTPPVSVFWSKRSLINPEQPRDCSVLISAVPSKACLGHHLTTVVAQALQEPMKYERG